MTKGIVYVGGSSRHLMDQSAALVADRIARSIQGQLRDDQPFSWYWLLHFGRLLSSLWTSWQSRCSHSWTIS